MISSKSFTDIRKRGEYSKNYSRCTYFNEQITPRKDNSTIFHSPYKNGKKNKQYTNPSFISSHLFYPEESQKQSIKVNLVKNKNQEIQEKLYHERISKLDQKIKKIHQKSWQKKFQESRKTQLDGERSRRKYEEKDQLVKELKTLISFNERTPQKQTKHQQSTAAFLDVHKKQKQQKEYQQRMTDLKEWHEITSKINNMKKSMRRENREKEKEWMNISVKRNHEKNIEKERESRRNAGLLSEILKEQIKEKSNRYQR